MMAKCVISIVGMSGMGKTTLARSLYNTDQVKAYSDLRAWVCVSEDFDAFKISKIIYEEVSEVNKAAIIGVIIDSNALRAEANGLEPAKINWLKLTTKKYSLADECLEINYGAKRTIKLFPPLLHLSNSPRIVSVSSSFGLLKFISSEWARGVFNDAENLTEERVDEILKRFLNDFKEGDLEAKGWPRTLSAYTLWKAAMNAYTGTVAKKCPSLLVKSVNPGFVNTDMNSKIGP